MIEKALYLNPTGVVEVRRFVFVMSERLYFVETKNERFIINSRNKYQLAQFIRGKEMKDKILVFRRATLFDAQLKDLNCYRIENLY